MMCEADGGTGRAGKGFYGASAVRRPFGAGRARMPCTCVKGAMSPSPTVVACHEATQCMRGTDCDTHTHAHRGKCDVLRNGGARCGRARWHTHSLKWLGARRLASQEGGGGMAGRAGEGCVDGHDAIVEGRARVWTVMMQW